MFLKRKKKKKKRKQSKLEQSLSKEHAWDGLSPGTSSQCFASAVIAHSHHFLAPPSTWVSHFFLLFFWLHWLCAALRRLSLAVVSRGQSSLQWAGFSLRWLLLLACMGSRAQQLGGTGLAALRPVEHPRSGMEPTSLALAGGLVPLGHRESPESLISEWSVALKNLSFRVSVHAIEDWLSVTLDKFYLLLNLLSSNLPNRMIYLFWVTVCEVLSTVPSIE